MTPIRCGITPIASFWLLVLLLSLPVDVAPFVVVKSGVMPSPLTTGNKVGVALCMISESEKEALRLREEAERIRKDISTFEQAKEEAKQAEKKAEQQLQTEKKAVRMRYSAEVPILKGDGQTMYERVDFPPRFPKETSTIETCEASLPLGIILGEHEEIPGAIRVDEVVEGGNGDISGVQVGDLLRACTACQTTMETPTWQLIAGGIGQPKTKRFMFSIDGRPFEEVMDAVASNRMDPEERPAVLVLERRE